MRYVNLVIKRFFDIIISLSCIILFTIIPIFIIVPVLIKVSSNGPIIFKQKRVGKDQREYTMYKFRTMIVEQYDKNGNEIMSEDRITRIGKILRKTSLDELPQLFNVLNGTMSLIGPRPMLPYQAPRCVGDEVLRFNMRPGITGLAQAKGRNNISWPERIKYDIQYVKEFNILLDFQIIIWTILIVLKHDGTDVVKEYRGVDRFSKHYKPDDHNSEYLNCNGENINENLDN